VSVSAAAGGRSVGRHCMLNAVGGPWRTCWTPESPFSWRR